ncbi:hypothetical protein ACH5RR_007999 [Cinchona calisaya]|uniref:Acid phosphatase n=1 Tax=Cinchona calisaya TaxID=153742 RepID=A0ABD3ADY2_9GENT
MAIAFLFLYFLAFAAATTSHASIPLEDLKTIHPLRPTATATAGHPLPGIDCLSWRLAVETDNIKNWDLVPATCENYVGHYMLGMQYRHDCDVVADVAIKFAKTLRIPKDGRSIWVFDIDETAFSNLPYYAGPDVAFGAKPYNATSFDEYAATANVPALPASLRLYQNLVKLGIKAVFITGSSTSLEKARIINLKRVGYYTWEKLVLKDSSDKRTSLVFKSEERTKLVAQGYRIVGNIGDQWSDILGNNTGSRTFKLPDPMYYVA